MFGYRGTTQHPISRSRACSLVAFTLDALQNFAGNLDPAITQNRLMLRVHVRCLPSRCRGGPFLGSFLTALPDVPHIYAAPHAPYPISQSVATLVCFIRASYRTCRREVCFTFAGVS